MDSDIIPSSVAMSTLPRIRFANTLYHGRRLRFSDNDSSSEEPQTSEPIFLPASDDESYTDCSRKEVNYVNQSYNDKDQNSSCASNAATLDSEEESKDTYFTPSDDSDRSLSESPLILKVVNSSTKILKLENPGSFVVQLTDKGSGCSAGQTLDLKDEPLSRERFTRESAVNNEQERFDKTPGEKDPGMSLKPCSSGKKEEVVGKGSADCSNTIVKKEAEASKLENSPLIANVEAKISMNENCGASEVQLTAKGSSSSAGQELYLKVKPISGFDQKEFVRKSTENNAQESFDKTPGGVDPGTRSKHSSSTRGKSVVEIGASVDITMQHNTTVKREVNATKLENRPPIADDEETVSEVWGTLPKPDMTLEGLGERALHTHYVEKSLTMDTLLELHNALKSCPSENTLEKDPKGLKIELMPHQGYALAWMLWRERSKPSGGILGDEMGLGKTLSMISLILKDGERNDSGSSSDSEDECPRYSNTKRYAGGTLVVCPTSLMAQWQGEISKRVKRRRLTVELYHGANRMSRSRSLAEKDVVITSYHLLGRVQSNANGPLFCIDWKRIILDEAHIVRNHLSLMAKGVCELEAQHRWCVTGTPLHNKEMDLYALLKFLRCSPFDELPVWKRWVDNKDPAGMQRLNTMMKTLLLRRTKEQLQERGEMRSLLPRTSEIVTVSLDPEEMDLYEKIAEYSKTLFSHYLLQRQEKQQRLDFYYGFSASSSQQKSGALDKSHTINELAQFHRNVHGLEIKSYQILILLLRLRQVCCHPNLALKMISKDDLGSSGGSEFEMEDLEARFSDMNITVEGLHFINEEKRNRIRVMSADNPVFTLDRSSAKMRAIWKVLKEKVLGTNDKAIIVSQWTSFLSIILKYLTDKGVACSSLTGEVPVTKRQEVIDEFNMSHSGPKVLLMSLSVGGVGLNLVGANHMLITDIHWNPQLEMQAFGRVHRVGQKKPVFIYRFIVSETIEERVKLMQDIKLAMAEDVLTGTVNHSKSSHLTLDDLMILFNFNTQSIESQN